MEEEDEKGMRWKSGPFRSPSRPRYLLQYAEYVQGVQGTQFRLHLKRIEDSREGRMEGWMEEVVQRSLCKLIRKKTPISNIHG